MTKQESLNKLYNIFNKVAGGNKKYPLATIDALRFVILDIKVQNKADFVQYEVFDLLKNDFNIKSKGVGFTLDLKNN